MQTHKNQDLFGKGLNNRILVGEYAPECSQDFRYHETVAMSLDHGKYSMDTFCFKNQQIILISTISHPHTLW